MFEEAVHNFGIYLLCFVFYAQLDQKVTVYIYSCCDLYALVLVQNPFPKTFQSSKFNHAFELEWQLK